MAKTVILQSILIAYISLVSIVSIEANADGFTIDLIRRDSSLTPSGRIANALQRSLTRIRYLQAKIGFLQSPQTDLINAAGEFLIKYSIGTPPVPALGIVATGSDAVWTQCQPCIKCFKQDVPIFKPNTSSTYKKIPCNSVSCKSAPQTTCSKTKNNCLYSQTYSDGSFTNGELATDTITLSPASGRSVPFPNIVLGCGFKNNVGFPGGESGIVGLGGGKLSLISQLNPAIQGKFSYCLVPESKDSNTSKLSFGANAVVSGKGVVSTPLVSKNPDTFYFVTLDGISVGNQRFESDNISDANKRQGNAIIDTGTTLSTLPSTLYDKLLNALKSSIKLKQVQDPQGVLDLCYLSRTAIQVPDVTVHFRGADVKLKVDNVFVRTSDTTLCLAFQRTRDVAVFGNVAQGNFLVGYDLQKRTVSFKPTVCGA